MVISTPGVVSRSQWLGRDVPPWFSVSSRSSGKKPYPASVDFSSSFLELVDVRQVAAVRVGDVTVEIK